MNAAGKEGHIVFTFLSLSICLSLFAAPTKVSSSNLFLHLTQLWLIKDFKQRQLQRRDHKIFRVSPWSVQLEKALPETRDIYCWKYVFTPRRCFFFCFFCIYLIDPDLKPSVVKIIAKCKK